jgi:hypothetical protein
VKGVSQGLHGGHYEENRGGDDKLTEADRRSMAWTECKAWGGTFYRCDTGSEWDGMEWQLVLGHAQPHERAERREDGLLKLGHVEAMNARFVW